MKFNLIIADGGATVVVIVVIVVAGFLWWLLTRDTYRVVLTAPSGTAIKLNQNVPVTVVLQTKSWMFGAWTNLGSTFTVKINALTGVLGPSPMSGSTTATGPATITVVGTAVGRDNLRVTFSIPGSTDTVLASVPMTVAE